MSIASLAELAKNDPSWDQALKIAQRCMPVASNVWRLLRAGWYGQVDYREYMHMLGFSRLNLFCLIDCAGLSQEGEPVDAKLLERALQKLGLRFSSVVLAINHVCSCALSNKAPPAWKRLMQETMSDIEIGYHFGARAGALGLEGGCIMGLATHAGHLALMKHDPVAFKKWYTTTKELQAPQAIFGCEPYQLAACIVQQLGFGHEAAIGVALALGRLNPKGVSLDKLTLGWKSAVLWVEALREGRGYPAEPEMRHVFHEVAPPRDTNSRNPILDTLYAEVSHLRTDHSKWTWHLPKSSYDLTSAAFGLGLD
ncbi:MAG: hypothetical protein DCC75_01440 [Proteobacteria bacterium]|nr:MAG: hypothetical protein DCC75_01440 [Pseudomonadota bacterium]